MDKQKNLKTDIALNCESESSDFFASNNYHNSVLDRGISSPETGDNDNTISMPENQKKKSMFSSKRFLVNIIVVIALALFVGVQGGLFYLDTFVKSYAPPSIAEESIRDDSLAIYSSSVGKSPEQLSALNAAIVADYMLTNSTSVKKVTSGNIVAMGVTQKMAAKKIRVGDHIYTEKLSTGLLSVGNAFHHTLGSDLFEFYTGSSVTLSGATWPSSPSYTWNYDTYIDHFRSKPEYFINYIISSYTVHAATMSKLPDGTFKISLDLDAVYSVLNYVYEIRETSGSSKFPNFKSVHLDMVIDSSYRVLTLDIDETYDVAVVQLGGGYVETHAVMHEVFTYEGVTIDG